MKLYVLLDGEGYVRASSPEANLVGCIEVDVLSDFDTAYQHCYQMAGNRLRLDEEKKARAIAEQADEERIERIEQGAVKRLQEIQAQKAAREATADDVIAISPLLPEWTTTVYHVGDVVAYNGVPYKCVQSHDSANNPAWNPKEAVSLWASYHAASAQYALPWAQPTGAHDAYQPGEWMIWTDGAAYRCTINNTVYPPDAHPAAWRK